MNNDLVRSPVSLRKRLARINRVSPKIKSRSPQIVVIDDCAEMVVMWETILIQVLPEARVVKFQDSDRALCALEKKAPDLFITDLMHPGISGFDLLKRLALMKVNYPIIVASGNLGLARAGARRAAGPDLKVSFWDKPFPPVSMQDHVKALVG